MSLDIPPIMLALAAVIAQVATLISAISAAHNSRKIKKNLLETDKTVDKIHIITNSKFEALKEQNNQLLQKNELLMEKLVAALEKK